MVRTYIGHLIFSFTKLYMYNFVLQSSTVVDDSKVKRLHLGFTEAWRIKRLSREASVIDNNRS